MANPFVVRVKAKSSDGKTYWRPLVDIASENTYGVVTRKKIINENSVSQTSVVTEEGIVEYVNNKALEKPADTDINAGNTYILKCYKENGNIVYRWDTYSSAGELVWQEGTTQQTQTDEGSEG